MYNLHREPSHFAETPAKSVTRFQRDEEDEIKEQGDDILKPKTKKIVEKFNFLNDQVVEMVDLSSAHPSYFEKNPPPD